jgi:hypothetical protein
MKKQNSAKKYGIRRTSAEARLDTTLIKMERDFERKVREMRKELKAKRRALIAKFNREEG